jgi:sulfite exporter TauE/SafE
MMNASEIGPVLTSALLLGAFGSVHCLGMCGGIAGALGQATVSRAGQTDLPRLSLYSFGRITSYSAAGAAVGLLGEAFSALTGVTVFLRLLTGLLILACGLHILGVWNGLAAIERVGMRVWRGLAPYAKRVGRPDRGWKIFVLGLLWGWLPCGLVYAALVGAASTGSALLGAGFMAAFGLGTLPALLAASGFGAGVGSFLGLRSARRAAGVLLMVFGIASIAGALMPLMHSSAMPASGHAHHATTE